MAKPSEPRERERADAERIAELRAVAERADEGGRTWEWEGGYPQRVLRVGDVVIVADVFESPDAPSRFAEHIATFDPPTVLWLIAALESLLAERAPADSDTGQSNSRLTFAQAVDRIRDAVLAVRNAPHEEHSGPLCYICGLTTSLLAKLEEWPRVDEWVRDA